MQSSQTPDNAELLDKLKSLLNCSSLAVTAKKGGGNSLVLCVEGNNENGLLKRIRHMRKDSVIVWLNEVYQF